jgi:hypothetical protein
MPVPPETTKAPSVVEVLCVIFVIVVMPATDKVVPTVAELLTIKPDTVLFPLIVSEPVPASKTNLLVVTLGT